MYSRVVETHVPTTVYHIFGQPGVRYGVHGRSDVREIGKRARAVADIAAAYGILVVPPGWTEDETINGLLANISRVTVSIPGADCRVRFAEGESIWTESSYKYETEGIAELAAAAGFARRDQWVDADARFAVTAFDAR